MRRLTAKSSGFAYPVLVARPSARRAFMLTATLCALMMTPPVLAQQSGDTEGEFQAEPAAAALDNETIDLTNLAGPSDTNSDTEAETLSSESDAQDEAPNTDELAAEELANDDTQLDLTKLVDAEAADNQTADNETANNEAGGNETGANASLASSATSNNGDDAEITDGTDATDTATQAATSASPRIDRRALSNIGLVSIGLDVKNPARSKVNSLIWQGSEAEKIASLWADTPAYGPAQEMNRLVLSALLRQAVPPMGAAQMADDLVDARLNWLAEAGQSDALAQLIRKLPNDERWQTWQRWLVTYDLLQRADDSACMNVYARTSETMDPFWHQAQVVCHILSGNVMQASFTADMVQAAGLADQQFSQLVDLFLGRRDEVALNEAELTPLHLVLMDAAHMDISNAQLAVLPVSMLQARTALRYLQPDAQMQVGFQTLKLGLADGDDIAGLLRSLYAPDQTVIEAAARFEAGKADMPELVRTNLYTQLAGALIEGQAGEDFDMLLRQAMYQEVALGDTSLLMPYYAEVIDQRVAAADLPQITPELQADFAVWLAVNQPDETPLAVFEGTSEVADVYRRLLSSGTSIWSADMLAAAGGWDWLPLLQIMGVQAPVDLQLEGALDGAAASLPLTTRQPVHPLRLIAIQAAADRKQVGEVILLAAQALDGIDLALVDSRDLAHILQLLRDVGLEESAQHIAAEAVKARMLSTYFASADG